LIVTDYFKNQISSAARSSILNEIRRFELFTDGRSAQVTLKRPDLIIERSRLIRSLAEEAVHAGAKLRYDTRFLDLSPNAKGLHVQVDEGGKREELHAASVVGADGAASRVARAAGWPPVENRSARSGRHKTSQKWPAGQPRASGSCPTITPYFYWMIPESPERAAVGVIGDTAAPRSFSSTAS